MLYEHMKEGLSFQSFGGVVGVSIETLYTWEEKYTEFLDAKKRGKASCLLWWEKLGRAGTAGRISNFNTASWIFNMKNRFEWRDKKDIDLKANMQGNVVILPDNKRDKK
jgi:hypothetical protein